MRPSNPACYECPKNESGIHAWMKRSDGTARCFKCRRILSKEDTAEVYEGFDRKMVGEDDIRTR